MNKFIEKIKTLALNNKYTKWYCQIIERGLTRPQNRKILKETIGYVELHHVLPHCIDANNNKENLVFLTAREHFIVHALLTKMFEFKLYKIKLSHAFKMFKSQTKVQFRYFNSKIYSKNKLDFSYIEQYKSPWLGRKHSEKTKQKMKDNHYDNSGEKHHMWGKQHSPKTIKLMSNKSKQRDYSNYGKSVKQIDIKTNYIIKIWNNIQSVQNTLGILVTNISRVCRGKAKTTGGFKWEYINKESIIK